MFFFSCNHLVIVHQCIRLNINNARLKKIFLSSYRSLQSFFYLFIRKRKKTLVLFHTNKKSTYLNRVCISLWPRISVCFYFVVLLIICMIICYKVMLNKKRKENSTRTTVKISKRKKNVQRIDIRNDGLYEQTKDREQKKKKKIG